MIPESRRVNLRDIAEDSGVSIQTVSRVVRGINVVAEETRVRVMANYLHVDVDRLNPAGPEDSEPFGPPPGTPPPGVQIGQTFNILAVRIRYSF